MPSTCKISPFILVAHKDSSFIKNDIICSNKKLNDFLKRFKEEFTEKKGLETFEQFILTESDLKCNLYRRFCNYTKNKNVKVFTEIADRPEDNIINNITNSLENTHTNNDDERKKFVRTDFTIANKYRISKQTLINKSFTLCGEFIDIELKYIRSSNSISDDVKYMKDDLEKLEKLIKKGKVKNQGQTLFGLCIFAFKNEMIYNDFSSDQNFKNDILNSDLDNIKILILINEEGKSKI